MKRQFMVDHHLSTVCYLKDTLLNDTPKLVFSEFEHRNNS